MTPKRSLCGHQGDDGEERQHDPDGKWDAEKKALSEQREACIAANRLAAEIGKGLAVRQEQRGASRYVECSQCRNERSNTGLRNQPTVQEANGKTDSECDENCDQDARVMNGTAEGEALCQQVACHHPAQPCDGADREIDASRQDDERHANREDRGDGDVFRQNGEIIGGEEGRRQRGEQDEQQQQHENGASAEEKEKCAH